VIEFELFAPGTDVDILNNYYVYLRRDADGLYYDSDDTTFKAFGSLVDGQLELAEDANQPGVWQFSLTTVGATDGPYTILPRDGQTDVLFDAQVGRVYLVNDVPLVSLVRPQIHLHDQYTGVDNYKLIAQNGDPVSGASVRVFTKSDYDANNVDVPLGITTTDDGGLWLDPIPVNPGDTYTIVFHKTGAIGPTSVEVIVP
jgi:hypothetical protein